MGMGGTRPLRIAFVGSGNMAGLHLAALARVPTAHQLVGVYDVRPEAARAFAQRAGTEAFGSLPTMLAAARPDVVHVCTTAGMHFEAARQALQAGAHVYVEKPFVETQVEADALFALARERGLFICAGHQLVRDPAFNRLLQRAAALQPITLVDSSFAFRPPRLDPDRSSPHALADQLLDILPHPLYTLVAALERFVPGGGVPVEILHATATPTMLHALLRAGEVLGRLCVSLRSRPVASTLTVTGAHGALTTDFVRAIVVGAANEGTSPIEKIANPFLEAGQLAWRSAASLAKRLLRGAGWPGLVELMSEFYAAAATGDRPPLSPDHLRRVTVIYEQLAATVRSAVHPVEARAPEPTVAAAGPLVVVTGAAGFFGRAISRSLALRGFRVRGIGRSVRPDDPYVHEWVRADLAAEIPAGTLSGAAAVVHAAAETAGGFEAHERNTVGATRLLLQAMAADRVQRLVHVSTISVLRPPHPFWERQSERTPLAERPERLGAYTWGKCAAEALVAAAAERQEIQARIVRPAALIDWRRIDFPGLLGRRLFGRWHLGLGRPGLPFAVCEVESAGAVVAWCVERFADAPPVINLLDPAVRTRRQLLHLFRRHGWRGRVLWVPISLLAGALVMARAIVGLARRERGRPLAAWAILRPRRYDAALAAKVLAAAAEDARPVRASFRASPAPLVSRAYG